MLRLCSRRWEVSEWMNDWMNEWTNIERLWTDTDKGKPKYSEKNLSQFHFVHHKSQLALPGIKPRPPRWEAGN
jgi:hypothetical protein